MDNPIRVGFLGAGGIAQAHAYALDALKYYYSDSPTIEKAVVASPTLHSREGFAARFGFKKALPPEEIWTQEGLDALYLLGPNQTHTLQLLKAASLPNIQRIYVEKPIGVSHQDIYNLTTLNDNDHGKFIMVGFQFLQKSAIRKALTHWHTGDFGQPIHFRAAYLHSSYLEPAYRQKHPDRLQPIPINGATADLGSHALSLLVAFLGDKLVVKTASASGNDGDIFPNVPKDSDLCTTALINDTTSGAVGTMIASRISAGAGDHLSLEIRGTKGALQYTTSNSGSYETYLPDEGWRHHEVMSDYLPASKFPSDYAPPGWLRSLVHNHYLFLGGDPGISMIPDLSHGILVQRLIQQIAEFILMS